MEEIGEPTKTNTKMKLVHGIVLFVISSLAIATTEKVVQSGYQKFVLDRKEKNSVTED